MPATLRAFVDCPPNLSQAMYRTARAVKRYAPPGVTIVKREEEAEFVLLHVIGYPETAAAVDRLMAQGRKFGLLMYCLRTTQRPSTIDWLPLWTEADIVWSYYDTPAAMSADGIGNMASLINSYRSPLGIDDAFLTLPDPRTPRPFGAMSSGYVSASCAEAIEEIALAGARVGCPILHLGPGNVEGMAQPAPGDWTSVIGIGEGVLADHYRRCRYVSGLRHGEGFELPVIEGLACGARPIVFDRPDMHAWYDGHALFVPELSGGALVDALVPILAQSPAPVMPAERALVLARFNWATIVDGFWASLRREVLDA